MQPFRWAIFLALIVSFSSVAAAPIETTPALVAAVHDAAAGDTIEIAAGTFELDAPLELKPEITLKGAGIDNTILTHSATWHASPTTLPDPEMRTKGMDTRAFLIVLQTKEKASPLPI